MKWMPLARSSSAWRLESVHRVLPPSMTRAPGSSSSASRLMLSSVAWPDGTITQTVFGFDSLDTRSSTDCAPTPPSATAISTVAGVRAYPTMRWPRWARRLTMLPPMRPSPMMPISSLPGWATTASGLAGIPLVAIAPPSLSALPGGRGPFHQLQYLRHRSLAVDGHRHHRHPPAMVSQALEVARPLRLDERLEPVDLARDRDLVAPAVGQDQVDAGVGSALVELAGGVEIARAVSRRGRHRKA